MIAIAIAIARHRFVQYLSVHERIASRLGKPLVLEEFGLTWHKVPEYDRRVLMQVRAVGGEGAGSAGGRCTGAGHCAACAAASRLAPFAERACPLLSCTASR